MEEEVVKEKQFLIERNIKTFADLMPKIVQIEKYSFYRKKWIDLGFLGYDELRVKTKKGSISWNFVKNLLQESHLKIIIEDGEITDKHMKFL